MAPRYEKGQRVIVRPVGGQIPSPRDAGLEPYAGRVGQITDFFWISKEKNEIFFLYTVRIEPEHKEIVLHEDELDVFPAFPRKSKYKSSSQK